MDRDNSTNPHSDALLGLWRIYGRILKFFISSMTAFLIDYGAFVLFNLTFLMNPLISYMLARLISSFINFMINWRVVFCNNKKSNILKYYCLAICIMLVGAAWTGLLTKFGVHSILAKFSIDIPLFFVSYTVQRKYIFKSNNA